MSVDDGGKLQFTKMLSSLTMSVTFFGKRECQWALVIDAQASQALV